MSAACDVCNRPTSWGEGTGYTADEFRGLVARGFEPDEALLRQAAARGIPAAVATRQWKDDLVARSTSGWLLCPSCASRAARYGPKAAGASPADLVHDELFVPNLLPPPAPVVPAPAPAAPPRTIAEALFSTPTNEPPATTPGATAPAPPASTAPTAPTDSGAPSPGVPFTLSRSERPPVDTSVLDRVDAALAGRDLQDGARAVLLLRLAQAALPHSVDEARGYWAKLGRLANRLPPDRGADVAALRAVLEPAAPAKDAPKGWVADALAEIGAAAGIAASDPAEAGRRLAAAEEALKHRMLPMGKGPVRTALADAWADVDRNRAIASLHDVPGDARPALLAGWNRSAPLRPDEWDLVAGRLGVPATTTLARGLLGQEGQLLDLPTALATALGEQIRLAIGNATTREGLLLEYLRLVAQPRLIPADREALYGELFRPDWPRFGADWPSGFRWYNTLVLAGVTVGVLTEVNVDRLAARSQVYATGFVRALHAAVTVAPGQVEASLRRLRDATFGDPSTATMFLAGVVRRGLGAEAVAAADRTGEELLRQRTRRAWLGFDCAGASAVISPGEMQGDPVGGFLALGTAQARAEHLRRATNGGQGPFPGPLWVVPLPPKPGGLKGLFAGAKKPAEVVREYLERTPLYGRPAAGPIPDKDLFAEYARSITDWHYRVVDGPLLEAIVVWGDRHLEEASAAGRASLQAILPEETLMWDAGLREALLERCATVMAADPRLLVDEFATWVRKEWVKRDHRRKADGGEQVLKFPREIPIQLCLRGAAAVAAISPARRDAIVARAIATHDANDQLVAAAARLYATDKPKLDLAPPPGLKRDLVAAWQTGIVEDAVPAIGAALAARTGTEPAVCDICNAPTTFEEGAAIDAGEFREIVARGFEPEALPVAEMFGIPRATAIEGWKRDLVAGSTTGWLLCPRCAARAARYRARG